MWDIGQFAPAKINTFTFCVRNLSRRLNEIQFHTENWKV